VRTAAALAELPHRATATRLGAEAGRLIAVARGRDETPLVPRPHATRFEEAMDLEWEVHDVESLAFVVKRLLDALMARLAARSLAVSSIGLTLVLGSRTRDERSIALPTPTRDVKTLVHLARASLDAKSPGDAVVAVVVSAVAAGLRGMQLDLFDPPGPAPEVLTLTLARLAALVGEGRVGRPVVPDTHRPHTAAVDAFVTLPARERRAGGDIAATPCVALHVFRPPREATVVLRGGRIVRVRADGLDAGVRASCGPFRVSGEWWGEPFEHDGYDVELVDGGVYVVGFDGMQKKWQLDGVYE
jgi:protein ImuB